tara:strand:- start:159 stop:1043 length:885 start_codon:yes stop_codon:yes gene_type:complete
MYNFNQSCILINKPSGISSNETLRQIKKKLKQKKAGFSGILDPMASGLLIIFLNKATKLCSYFSDADKEYDAVARLGKISSTGDGDGLISNGNSIPKLSKTDLKMIEEKYTGKISQVPPMFSAIKHNGKRLYKYAREGILINRKPRTIEIFKIEIKQIDSKHLGINVCCSKGTYIRALVEQIGEEIGCGAFLKKLVRTQIKDINISDSVTLDNFLALQNTQDIKNHIINVDKLLNNTYSYIASSQEKAHILNGNKVKIDDKPCSNVKIYDQSKQFIGIGIINDQLELLPKKILV